MIKILCLGNEFIKEDSFAKEIGNELKKENFDIINIKDSFQLIEELKNSGDFIILDVVLGLEEVRILGVDEISEIKIITAHDFDAGFVFKLFEGKNIRIIGIPMKGDIGIISKKIKKFI